MKRSTMIFGLATLLLAGGSTPAIAQAPKFSGLVQVWYTQMLDNNLRLNPTYSGNYFNLRSEFKENTFSIRRSEIKLSGSITEDVEYEAMLDPSINTSGGNPSILQDAAIVYKMGGGFEAKLGQFKNLQTHEGVTSSSEIMFAERAQLARQFGDKRDRGVALGYKFGDPKEFGGKVTLAIFNGLNDSVAGKGNDTNGQKDFVARLDLNYGKTMKFGFYTLQGSTDQADKGRSGCQDLRRRRRGASHSRPDPRQQRQDQQHGCLLCLPGLDLAAFRGSDDRAAGPPLRLRGCYRCCLTPAP
ncbi:MAG: hypothetical protein IPP78_09250 [Holophagaceae bacterium]|nr:hypothetical protein [Holophagaceae bacterium]